MATNLAVPRPGPGSGLFGRRAILRGAAIAAAAGLVGSPPRGGLGVVSAEAGERWDALRGLPRVAVEVSFSPNHPDLSANEVQRRLEEGLRRGQPAPLLDPTSPDRLHLMIAVRSYSTTDLRGFYLPLSQVYGIGPVRLVVERVGVIPALPMPVAAQVWQTERLAKGPWRNSPTEILELVDEVVASFLGDYGRAHGQ